jgi:hypothetical protein
VEVVEVGVEKVEERLTCNFEAPQSVRKRRCVCETVRYLGASEVQNFINRGEVSRAYLGSGIHYWLQASYTSSSRPHTLVV